MELVHPLRDHAETSGSLGLGDAWLGEPGDRQQYVEALIGLAGDARDEHPQGLVPAAPVVAKTVPQVRESAVELLLILGVFL